MSSNTTPISNPFEKSMLMMEIEKRDVEIAILIQKTMQQAEIISSMSDSLRMNSEIFASSVRISPKDWQQFLDLAQTFGFDLQPNDITVLSKVLEQFLIYKVGMSCVAKIDAG